MQKIDEITEIEGRFLSRGVIDEKTGKTSEEE